MKIMKEGKELEIITSACRLFPDLKGMSKSTVQGILQCPALRDFYPTSIIFVLKDISEGDHFGFNYVSPYTLMSNIVTLVVSKCSESKNILTLNEDLKQLFGDSKDSIRMLSEGYSTWYSAFNVLAKCLLYKPYGKYSGIIGILGANCIAESSYNGGRKFWVQLPDIELSDNESHFSLFDDYDEITYSVGIMIQVLKSFCYFSDER